MTTKSIQKYNKKNTKKNTKKGHEEYKEKIYRERRI